MNARRKWEERIFNGLMRLATLAILLILVLIIGSVIYKGYPSFTLSMITQTPKGGYYLGKEGGILNAIAGSLYLSFGATLIAFLIGLPVALYLNVYAKPHSKFVEFIRLCLDILYGIPSIVFGAFGFILMLMVGLGTSLLAGIIAVSLLILPIIIRSIDEVMKTIPKELYEASFSLGSTRWQTATKVIVRQSMAGIVTAFLLGFGRAIGDAAAVLYTAGFTDNVPTNILKPAATLPLAIFFQLSSPIKEVTERAYAAAMLLLIIILIVSIASRAFTNKYEKQIIK
jgi:phosphate transport system permease protein